LGVPIADRKSIAMKNIVALALLSLLGQSASLPAESPTPSAGEGIDGDPGTKTLKFPALTVDVRRGTVQAEGRVCMDKGVLEYVACGPGGKVHESLLILDCEPRDLLVAIQTLGLKPGRGVDFQGQKKVPTGAKVFLYVEWEQGGKSVRRRAEDLVWNAQARRSMRRTPWIFVGSRFEKDPDTGKPVFAASIEGNLVATYHDPYAILDHPLDTGADDTTYEVNTKLVPKAKTPVKLVIAKEEAKKSKSE